MLLVRTYTAPSPIHGTGLFAAEPIPEGTAIWEFTPGLDQLLYHQPEGETKDWSWREEDCWVVPQDDARFINHSLTPSGKSGGSRHGIDRAARDILPGEEITLDYATFDLDYPEYEQALR